MPTESDWKNYCKIVEPLRDRYLSRRNAEFAQQLHASDKSPTESFWETLEAMDREGKRLNKALGPRSRSRMEDNLIGMCSLGMITEADLEGFSDDLAEYLKQFLKPVR